MKKQKGFTLIELLIVIAIIGLLATLAIVSLTSAQKKARDTKRVADVKSIQTALELYYNNKGAYPTLNATANTGTGVAATWSDLQTILSPYITTLPVDANHPTAFYTYITNNNLQYYLSADLEDVKNAALNQDVDGNVAGTGWFSIESDASALNTLADAAPFSCGVAGPTTDDIYCINGNASQ